MEMVVPTTNSFGNFEQGMSKVFVNSLRQIFDVLDNKKTGAVKLSEIASKWVEDENVPDLPKGLMRCLHKVTPPNGLLTFDRFCAGVRICLLKNQADFINNNRTNRQLPSANSQPLMPQPPVNSPTHLMLTAPPSAGANDKSRGLIKPTASVSPVPSPNFLRTIPNGTSNSPVVSSNYPTTRSMPQLQMKCLTEPSEAFRSYQSDAKLIKAKNNKINPNRQQTSTFSKSAIMKTLLNWRDNVLKKQSEIETIETFDNKENLDEAKFGNNLQPQMLSSAQLANWGFSTIRKPLSKRREPRRHTVGANGIDYNTIRRMQQIEQEREVLLQGLNTVHQARDWYLRQIAVIQDKLKFAGREGANLADYSLDAHQERINFLAARVLTVNQHLALLMDSERGFPIHMNLALRPIVNVENERNKQPQLVVNPNLVNRLKEQNRLLTDEVGKKSDRITQLEREKSALIRELFQARTTNFPRTKIEDDTTFM